MQVAGGRRSNRRTFRDSDLFARIGCDEFVVLLTNMTQEQAAAITSRLEQGIAHYCQEADRGYVISFACGIVEYDPDTHQSVEELMAAGDAVMYERKKQER